MRTPKVTVKPKRVRRDRTDEILEKTAHLFGEYGFQGTALAQISEAVGMTDAGVLHYFPSKVHLLQGVLQYREQKEIEKYTEKISSQIEDLPSLFSLLEEVVADGEKVPGLIQLFSVLVGESLRHDHPSHDFFVERYRRGREMYVRQFVAMSNLGIRPDVNLDDLAALIMAVMDGLQIQWLLDPEKVDMVKTFSLFSDIMVAYLKK